MSAVWAEEFISVFHRVSTAANSVLSLDEIIQQILALALESTGSDAGLVLVLDESTGDVVLYSARVKAGEPAGKLLWRASDGAPGREWFAPVIAIPSGAHRDGRWQQFAWVLRDTFDAWISAPLTSAGRILGAVQLHYREPHEFTDNCRATMAFLGEQLGGSVDRARLIEDNRRLEGDLNEGKRQLEARKLVERAKGILMQRQGLTEEEAYLRLRNDSRRSRRSMRELAQEIIDAEIKTRQKAVERQEPGGPG